MDLPSSSRRRIVAGLATTGAGIVLGLLVPSTDAAAAVKGRFRLTRHAIDETEQGWRIMMTIRLDSAPPTAQISLLFHFRQHVDFEGADGKTKRLVSPPKLITVSQDVDFAGPDGKVGQDARAELLLARDQGYRAGEWRLQVEGPDGLLGARADLTLRGVNPPAPPSSS